MDNSASFDCAGTYYYYYIFFGVKRVRRHRINPCFQCLCYPFLNRAVRDVGDLWRLPFCQLKGLKKKRNPSFPLESPLRVPHDTALLPRRWWASQKMTKHPRTPPPPPPPKWTSIGPRNPAAECYCSVRACLVASRAQHGDVPQCTETNLAEKKVRKLHSANVPNHRFPNVN